MCIFFYIRVSAEMPSETNSSKLPKLQLYSQFSFNSCCECKSRNAYITVYAYYSEYKHYGLYHR